jgi:polar amino acid transport system permease protein
MTFFHIFGALLGGAWYTILVTAACMATGMAVGLASALLSRLQWKAVDSALAVYAYVFRGIPVLVLLFMVFFGLPGMGVKVSPFLSMVLSLGLISGAYLAEIFRGAMNAVRQDEIVAAEAMGMTRVQCFRYIVLPQMFRFSVPGMINEFTTVLKYTPFAYTVGIPEIMKEAMSLTAVTLRGLEIYVAVGVMYFIIYKGFTMLFTALERRYRIPGLTGV